VLAYVGRVPGDRPKQVDGAEAGAWIVPALEGDWGGRVKNFIPQIYEAYARIFHPVTDEDGGETTWAEVARRLGTTAHPEMQWHAIVGSYDSSNFTDSRWPGGDPWPGELETEKLDPLCAILAAHTRTPESTYFGMSTIHAGVADEWAALPLHEQRARDWVVLKGALAAIDEITLSDRHPGISLIYAYPKGQAPPPDYVPPERFSRESPNLIWPEDRAWFVASEVDYDSTLMGGNRALIDAVLASPDLEALEVDSETSLTEDADKLNPVPDPPSGWGEPQDPEVLTRNHFEDTFEMLSGAIRVATANGGILRLEVENATGPDWRVEAERSAWPADAVEALASATIEKLELGSEDEMRLHLSGGDTFEIVPRPREADDEPPSWRVKMLGGMTLKCGPRLFFEFPDE
jgi:hypothetical protein